MAASTYTCPYCRMQSAGPESACPYCGAPVDVRQRVSESGWTELPPVRDMARIQFGRSSAQIAGSYVPVIDCRLDPADSVYFTHNVLLWTEPSVRLSPLPMKGGWTRVMAGLPLVMMQAGGPGHVAFSRDHPGETIAVPIQARRAVDVREHHFVLASGSVAYDWFDPGVWYTTQSGDETETHYPLGRYMDRFATGDSPGLLVLHAGGNAFARTLAERETILVQPASLLYKDPTVAVQLHVERPRTGGLAIGRWGSRYLWLRLWGPGRVCIQSSYERPEDPGTSLVRTSNATSYAW